MYRVSQREKEERERKEEKKKDEKEMRILKSVVVLLQPLTLTLSARATMELLRHCTRDMPAPRPQI